MQRLAVLALILVSAACQAESNDTDKLRADIRKLTESLSTNHPSVANWDSVVKAHLSGQSGWFKLRTLCAEFEELNKEDSKATWVVSLGNVAEPQPDKFEALSTDEQELILADSANYAASFRLLNKFERLVPQSEQDVRTVKHYLMFRVFACMQNRLVLEACLGKDEKSLVEHSKNLYEVTGKLCFGVSEGPMLMEFAVRRRTLETLVIVASKSKDPDKFLKSLGVVSALESGKFAQLSGYAGICVLTAGVIIQAKAESAKSDDELEETTLKGFTETPSGLLSTIESHLRGLELLLKNVPKSVTSFEGTDDAALLQKAVDAEQDEDDTAVTDLLGSAVGAFARNSRNSLLELARLRIREFEFAKGRFPNLEDLEGLFPKDSSVGFDPQVGGDIVLRISEKHALHKLLGGTDAGLRVTPMAKK